MIKCQTTETTETTESSSNVWMDIRWNISALTQLVDQAGSFALLALQCVITEGDYTSAFMNAGKICMHQVIMR